MEINNYKKYIQNLNTQLNNYKNTNNQKLIIDLENKKTKISELQNIILDKDTKIKELENYINQNNINNIYSSNNEINLIFNSINSNSNNGLNNALNLSSQQNKDLQEKYNAMKKILENEHKKLEEE